MFTKLRTADLKSRSALLAAVRRKGKCDDRAARGRVYSPLSLGEGESLREIADIERRCLRQPADAVIDTVIDALPALRQPAR